jgi:hypothetical protein
MQPADVHALTMVAILAFALGSLVTMFLVMIQNGKRNGDDIELPESENEGAENVRPKRAEPIKEKWVRDADWWK